MTAPPLFLLHYQPVLNESVSQSGSYEHATVSLFEGSAGHSKCHYPEKK
jgi:hypothetical protein